MPLLGFRVEFVRAVENGLARLRGEPLPHPGVRPKRQTIRAYRKDGRDPKVGDTLYLYTGLRQRGKTKKIGEVACTFVGNLRLDGTRSSAVPGAWTDSTMILNGIDIDRSPFSSQEEVAHRDGFGSVVEMLNWFEATHGLPFEGLLVRW